MTRPWPGFLLLASCALGTAGCAGGLAAAGPLITVLQLAADRTVERTLPADATTVWAATVDALGRLGIAVRDSTPSGTTRVLTGDVGAVSVRAELTPVTPALTRLSLRVEAGMFQADKRTADAILDRIAASLPEATVARDGGVWERQAAALAAAADELRRATAVMAARRAPGGVPEPATPAAGPAEPKTAVPVTTAIFAVPESFGLPRSPAPTGADEAVAPRLAPLDVLVPVGAISRRSD